jgi:hypothetical protein
VADDRPHPTASEAAAALRSRREELVRSIAGGTLRLPDLVGDDDAGPVKVVVLAEAVPGVGKVRSRHILEAMGVDPGTRWAELGTELAGRVAGALELAVTDGGASPTGAR